MKRALLLVLAVAGAWAADAPARTVAVGAVGVEAPLAPVRARAREVFETGLEAWLAAHGYRVIPAVVTDSVWRHVRDASGGFYDPFTGRIVPAKYESVYEGTRRALREDLGADAWMVPSIETVSPGFDGDEAHWHGTREASGGRGGLSGLLLGRTTGTLNAMSLAIRLRDLRRDSLVYGRYGGIQLTSKVVGGDLLAIDPDSLLRDTARNRAAVQLALDSLVARWPPR